MTADLAARLAEQGDQPDPLFTVRLCECGCGQAARPRLGGRGRHPRYAQGHQPDGRDRGAARFSNTGRAPSAPTQGAGPPPAPEAYAEQLRGISEQLVAAVHDEGPESVRAHLRHALRLPVPVGVDPVEALVVVLAAQVDPDAPTSRRLGWVEALDSARCAG